MKIEIEVPEEIVKQFGKAAIETYLAFKVENMAATMLTDFADKKVDNPEVTSEQTAEAWEKVKRMGPSC